MHLARLKKGDLLEVVLMAAAATLAGCLLTLLYASGAWASTFTVTNLSNSGPGSLREAMEAANATTGADEIVFADGVSGTIHLEWQLPEVTDSAGLTIDGGNDMSVSGISVSGDPMYNTILVVGQGAKLEITNLTIGPNHYGDGTSGIYNAGTLTVANSTLSDNSTYEGGAGAIYNGGTATVTNSIFSGNTSEGGGGGIINGGTAAVANSTFSGNNANSGGAIYNGGTAAVTNSTFSRNGAYTEGAGIYNGGTATVTNSTFSGNNADFGGGISNDGTAAVTNSTFSGNYAEGPGGGISNDGTAAVTLSTTILANNTGGNCIGLIADGSYNIEDGTSCGFSQATGSLPNTNPLLDPAGLADNGGPTKTIALLPESPAVDLVGATTACPPPVTDQRGVERPQGEACDSGAFELEQGPPPYPFSGFFSPVNNPPTINVVKAGRAVPVKFSLGADEGLDIFAEGYPKSSRISCSSSAPLDAIEQSTSTAGGSGLSYDATTKRYTYVWKTKKAWSGTCRQLVVKLDDGSVHRANFRFK